MWARVMRQLAVALCVAGTALAEGENMLISIPLNGDFEEISTLDSGSLMPKGWQLNDGFVKNGGCEAVEGGQTGKYAFRIHAERGPVHAFTSTSWPVVLGSDAEIRCQAKGQGSFGVTLYCYQRGGNWVGGNLELPPVTLGADWQEFSFIVRLPETPFPKGVVEVVKLALVAAAGADVWLDQVSLKMQAPPMGATGIPAAVSAGDAPILELTLPPVLYAVPGIETNVYFENTVLAINPANLVFDVTCPKGAQQRERWTFVPKPEDVGTHLFSLAVYGEGNHLLAEASSMVKVVDPAAAAQLSVLIIGDSLTNASVYPARVLEACAQDANLKVRLIGTNVPRKDSPELRHEGYGGWTAARFASYFEAEAWKDGKRACSPFVFADAGGKPGLDFARYYREQNEGNPPDVVTLLLGCNDTFGASETGQADAIAACLANLDILINSIRAVGPNTVIGILLLAPPAATQDAFGTNYGCGQTRWQYRRNQHRLVERTLERYGKRESDGIWLLPTSVIVDPYYGFPAVTVKANAHSSVDIVRLNNGVHPNEAGYRQIGDALYAWLKDVAARRK